MHLKILGLLAALFVGAPIAIAGPGYKCRIADFSNPTQDSKEILRGIRALYVGREFVVDRRTGVMTGGLINNYVNVPRVIDHGSNENAFKVVTTLTRDDPKGGGRGSYIQMLVVQEWKDTAEKPFVFAMDAEIYSGTCTHF